jgi:hypothetical protein
MFNEAVLIKEFVNHMNGKYNLRVYYSEQGDRYRWHFGYPKQIIDILLPLLETTPYWGEQHWCEIDDYYLYWLPITTTTSQPNKELYKQLNREDKNLLNLYNSCTQQTKRWIG